MTRPGNEVLFQFILVVLVFGRPPQLHAPAAFLGSRNSTRNLTAHLLGDDPNARVVPADEIAAVGAQFRSIDLNLASQRSLQSAFDEQAFARCMESTALRDRAHLNTVSNLSAGAWLRAIPNPILGLTCYPPKEHARWCLEEHCDN